VRRFRVGRGAHHGLGVGPRARPGRTQRLAPAVARAPCGQQPRARDALHRLGQPAKPALRSQARLGLANSALGAPTLRHPPPVGGTTARTTSAARAPGRRPRLTARCRRAAQRDRCSRTLLGTEGPAAMCRGWGPPRPPPVVQAQPLGNRTAEGLQGPENYPGGHRTPRSHKGGGEGASCVGRRLRQHAAPPSTPHAVQHVQGERPAQQPGPVPSGCALLLCFRLRCCLRRGARLLRRKALPRLGEQNWPEFRARSEDAVESREVCSRGRKPLRGHHAARKVWKLPRRQG